MRRVTILKSQPFRNASGMKQRVADLQPGLRASPSSQELAGEGVSDEIMDVEVRGLLPFLAASNISVPSLKNKQTKC